MFHKVFFGLFVLLQDVSSYTSLQDSVIYSSAEFPKGQATVLRGTVRGAAYRVYAVYQGSAYNSDAFNVRISDSRSLVQLSTLSARNSNGLLNSVTMNDPITVTDKSTTNITYTIYIVRTYITQFPVIPASFPGTVSAYNALFSAASGVTILSAEEQFNLYNFSIASLGSLYIGSTGYDSLRATYEIFYVMSASGATKSRLTVSGPIATLYNQNHIATQFSFQIDNNTPPPVKTLQSEAAFSIVSPGWRDINTSYQLPHPTNGSYYVRYDMGVNTYLVLDINTNDFRAGEQLVINVIYADGSSTSRTYRGKTVDDTWRVTTRQVEVTVTGSPNHLPRFLIEANSG